MFFISWRGIGLLVPALSIFAIMLGSLSASMLHLQLGSYPHAAAAEGAVVGGVVAGVLLFLVTRSIEGPRVKASSPNPTARPARRPSPGAFYYIPVRYWAFLVPALTITMAAYAMFGPPIKPSPAATPTPVATSPASGATSTAQP